MGGGWRNHRKPSTLVLKSPLPARLNPWFRSFEFGSLDFMSSFFGFRMFNFSANHIEVTTLDSRVLYGDWKSGLRDLHLPGRDKLQQSRYAFPGFFDSAANRRDNLSGFGHLFPIGAEGQRHFCVASGYVGASVFSLGNRHDRYFARHGGVVEENRQDRYPLAHCRFWRRMQSRKM